jgi:predicted DNA repair protein MutK
MTMAGASFFALLDDIASLLDDVASMSQVALKKTAGVLGDDLALNANQVTGFTADRELPVIWRIGVGSAVNKAILIPAALLLSTFLPWLVMPLLMLGGIYLCFEGVEKLLHAWLHPQESSREERRQAIQDPEVNMVDFEKTRITAAIRTDLILSAEIIVISLGIIREESFWVRLGVLCAVGVAMTLGVYGLVAAIVKIDDLGLRWLRRTGQTMLDRSLRACGSGLLWLAPWLLRILSIAGTAAMFLVGGGIVTHHVDWLHHLSEDLAHTLSSVPIVGYVLSGLAPYAFDAAFGIFAGAITVGLVEFAKRAFALWSGKPAPSQHHGH